MGYSAVNVTPGQSKLELLKNHAMLYVGRQTSNELARETILDLVSGAGGVYGIVERFEHPTGRTFRYALIVITITSTKAGQFSWRLFDEFSCPRITSMPERLLNKLTPIEELKDMHELSEQSLSYARQWRRDCTNEANRKKLLVDGNVIVFENPLSFTLSTGPVKASRFTVRKDGRLLRFTAHPEGRPSFDCKLSRFALDSRFSQG